MFSEINFTREVKWILAKKPIFLQNEHKIWILSSKIIFFLMNEQKSHFKKKITILLCFVWYQSFRIIFGSKWNFPMGFPGILSTNFEGQGEYLNFFAKIMLFTFGIVLRFIFASAQSIVTDCELDSANAVDLLCSLLNSVFFLKKTKISSWMRWFLFFKKIRIFG